MTGTIETTNNNICIKIDSILNTIQLFRLNKIQFNTNLYNNIIELKDEYDMGSINIITKYFLNLERQFSSKIFEFEKLNYD